MKTFNHNQANEDDELGEMVSNLRAMKSINGRGVIEYHVAHEEATHQLRAYIDKQVLLGRADELKQFLRILPRPELILEQRLAQLKEQLKGSTE